MFIAGKISGIILNILSRLSSILRTSEAKSVSEIGFSTKIGGDGRVINIHGNRKSISIGMNGYIRGEIVTFAHEGSIKIGDWFYLGPGSTIWSSDPLGVTIGNRVLISMGVHIHDTNSHPLEPEARFRQTQMVLTGGHPKENPGIRSAPITIGDDVWIGLGATIFKGVSIGDRAIVGAHAIVTADVPADGYIKAQISIHKN